MNLDREIALVFLEEASGYLAVLNDPDSGPDEQARAAAALHDAAGLVGLAEVKAAAASVQRVLSSGDTVDLQDAVARVNVLLERIAEDARRMTPRRPGALGPDSGFDADEAAELRAFFVEEAMEHLDGISRVLERLEKTPEDRALVDELLRKTHTLKGSAATVGLDRVSRAAHDVEDVLALFRSGRLAPDPRRVDALSQALDTLRTLVERGGRPEEETGLTERLRLELAAVRHDGEFMAGHDLFDETGAIPEPIMDSAPPEMASEPPEAAEARAEAADLGDERRVMPDRRRDDLHVLRIDASLVDQMMDGAGELVFDRTRIERRVTELRAAVRGLSGVRTELRQALAVLKSTPDASPELLQKLEATDQRLSSHIGHLVRGGMALLDDTDALRRTTTTLQDQLTRMRMQPVRQLFGRASRALRDMARRAGKRVELHTAGETVELDKTMVEQITDPLIQILRNAVAHGIEPEHARKKAGKPPTGHIVLAARHVGDSVFLEVSDDGAGIDTERIRQKLVGLGRLSPADAQVVPDERIIASIFDAGVSTREATDELAGRGVGLDAVREHLARLGGDITVTSRPGLGTTFSIRMPLTMALAQAMLFKVGGQVYALPNVHVTETTFIDASSPALPSHISVRDEAAPLVSLHRLLNAGEPEDARRVPAIVLDFAGRRLAVTCDKIVGAREIVIKGLGPLLAPLGLYAGATISGAGKVQLILDPAALVKLAFPQIRTTSVPVPIAAGDTSAYLTVPVVRATSPRVLLVDDSKTVRESVSRMLTGGGYRVDTAQDGVDAWERLNRLRYDLVVTDLEMPHMDGYDLIARVRGARGFRDLPLVVITSRSSNPNRERAKQLGASAFLAKPIAREVLLELVRSLLATDAASS